MLQMEFALCSDPSLQPKLQITKSTLQNYEVKITNSEMSTLNAMCRAGLLPNGALVKKKSGDFR